jgi:NTP pyrophosphatase (non-canonical NTP hydrolase)
VDTALNTEEYAISRRRFATYPDPGNNPYYPLLQLAAEAGEVAGVFAKAMRKASPSDAAYLPGTGTSVFATRQFKLATRDRVKDELGDVFWYAFALLDEYDLSLEEVLSFNIEKLTDRHGSPTISSQNS